MCRTYAVLGDAFRWWAGVAGDRALAVLFVDGGQWPEPTKPELREEQI